MSRFLIGSMIFASGLLAAVGAQAAVTPLPNAANNVVTVTAGGWSVTFDQSNSLNACSLNLGSGASTNCSPEGVTASVDAFGTLTLVYTLANGSALFTSAGTI